MSNQTGILGVRVDNITKQEIEQRIAGFLRAPSYSWIATVNPEIIMAAYDDIPYSEILNLSDLSVVDGAGLEYIQLLLGKTTLKHRYPGIDLINYILAESRQSKLKVLLFGGRETFTNGKTIGQATKEVLETKYPGLEISVEQGGEIQFDKDHKLQDKEHLISMVNSSGAQVMLAALSYPEQERFLHALKNQCPQLRLAVGVGGSFKFISGYTKRAPQWLQIIGLEWFYRLLFGKQTIKRIYKALIRFPLTVLYREIKPRYRKGNLAMIVNSNNEIFLGLRTRALPEEEHWQMPQGGQEEGEKARASILREVSEELGCDKKHLSILYKCRETHKYLIKNEYRFSTQGQQLGLWIIRFTGKDENIELDKRELSEYQWVSADKLFDVLYPTRHQSAKILMKYLPKSLKQ